jgi:hypothetical protein
MKQFFRCHPRRLPRGYSTENSEEPVQLFQNADAFKLEGFLRLGPSGSYDSQGSQTYGYSDSGDELLTYKISSYQLSSPWVQLDNDILAHGGTRTSYFSISGSHFIATATVKLIGTVTVPAGTYHDCRRLDMSLNDAGNHAPKNRGTYLLAPKVGVIRQGLYNLVTFKLVSWMSLTGGTVGGVDVRSLVPPVLTITAPYANQRVINTAAPVPVTGKASDNMQVTNVQFRLNGGNWFDATTANGWANWTGTINPVPGSNVVSAYAQDNNGNLSATKSVGFFFVVPSTLTLVTNGSGRISRSFKGSDLEVGGAYTVTAVAGTGYIFSNWVASWAGGGFVSSDAVLKFFMQTNLVLEANFVPNPFLGAKGTYNGLFGETNRTHEASGFFTLTLGDHGAYTASLRRGTNSYHLSGQFDVAGQASKTVLVGADASLVSMGLDFPDHLAGTVSNGLWVADLRANRAVFNAVHNPASQFKGKYTLIIPGNPDASLSPGGDGYGAVTVDAGGKVTWSGALADGNVLNESVALSGNGEWAFYAPLYGGKGSAWSWLTIDTNQPAGPVTGLFSWLKPARPADV